MSFSIAFITTEEILGGGEKNLLLVVSQLKKKGIHTLLIAPEPLYSEGIDQGLNMYKLKGYKRYWFHGIDLIRNDKNVYEVTEILDNYDFVHAYNSNALTLTKFTNSKIIYTCHGPWEISNSRKAEKILNDIGLPRQDLGVDLIAKSGNEYHAIQCKYHLWEFDIVKKCSVDNSKVKVKTFKIKIIDDSIYII